MGKYIDLINNMNVTEANIETNFSEDVFGQAISEANIGTNGYLGLGILIPLWFALFQHLAKRENLFELSQIQALISVNTIIFTIALIFLYIGILTTSQHFVYVLMILFLVNIFGMLRTNR